MREKNDNIIDKYIDENLYNLVKEIIEQDKTGKFYDKYKSKLLEIKSIIESSEIPKDYHGFRSIEQLIITRALEKFIDENTIKVNSLVDIYDHNDNLVGTSKVISMFGLDATIKHKTNTLIFEIRHGSYRGRITKYCRYYIKKKPRD